MTEPERATRLSIREAVFGILKAIGALVAWAGWFSLLFMWRLGFPLIGVLWTFGVL
jgi:hypothetical protein